VKTLLWTAFFTVAGATAASAAQFAVFSLAVIIWTTPSGRVVERVPLTQHGTPFSTLVACQEDLKNKITSRLASSAHLVSDAVKASVHFSNPDDHLVRVRDVVGCLPVADAPTVQDFLSD